MHCEIHTIQNESYGSEQFYHAVLVMEAVQGGFNQL